MQLWEKRVVVWGSFVAVMVIMGFMIWMALSIVGHVAEMHGEVTPAVEMIQQQAPEIVENIASTSDAVRANVPNILKRADRVSTSAEVVAQSAAELSENTRQVLKLAGLDEKAREHSMLAYANSVVTFVQFSEGRIGLAKLWGSGLEKEMYDASEWVEGERVEAVLLVGISNTRAEFLENVCKNKFGRSWYIVFDGQKPVELKSWILAHHPETIALFGTTSSFAN